MTRQEVEYPTLVAICTACQGDHPVSTNSYREILGNIGYIAIGLGQRLHHSSEYEADLWMVPGNMKSRLTGELSVHHAKWRDNESQHSEFDIYAQRFIVDGTDESFFRLGRAPSITAGVHAEFPVILTTEGLADIEERLKIQYASPNRMS